MLKGIKSISQDKHKNAPLKNMFKNDVFSIINDTSNNPGDYDFFKINISNRIARLKCKIIKSRENSKNISGRDSIESVSKSLIKV